MPNVFLGMDLGGTKLDFLLSDEDGRFLKKAREAAGPYDISGKGVSLCGKTRQEQGKIMVTGGNTPLRFAAQAGSGIAVMDAGVAAAQLFGLQRIGIGESVARANPWHVAHIAEKTAALTRDSRMLVPALHVEPTPIDTPARFGALALVVPESRYEAWAARMTRGHTGKNSADTAKARS